MNNIEQLNVYDDNLPQDKQKWITIKQIVVKTESDKNQLLLASKYIHDLDCIDTDYMAVNYIAHLYTNPELICVDNSENIQIPKQLIAEILHMQGDKCRYDHHGYCQAHNLQMKEECWVYRLKNLLTVAQ